MNPEYQQQAQRLQELRQQLESNYLNRLNPQGESNGTASGSGSASASASASGSGSGSGDGAASDPMIYPGLYAPSGFDMMGILIRIHQRPNPTIQLGNIDSGVALVLCDASQPDLPIVYCSEAFEVLSGYKFAEIHGHNCRFLQYPPQTLSPMEMQAVRKANEGPRRELRQKLASGHEVSVTLVNFTKDGRRFENMLTVVPIWWENGDGRGGKGNWYLVGFQADTGSMFQ